MKCVTMYDRWGRPYNILNNILLLLQQMFFVRQCVNINGNISKHERFKIIK